jgi:hypothetical protein
MVSGNNSTINEKPKLKQNKGVRVMVFNATFNNISVISWQSVLLVEETGVPGENHRPVASYCPLPTLRTFYISINKIN